jgi:hypothetical protein
MQRWLARLSFSFFIISAVLAWDAYTSVRGRGRALPEWRVKVQFAAAGVLAGLGLIGIRARHQMLEQPSREEDRP